MDKKEEAVMKKMRIIVALTCVLALGLVFTGCSCTKSSTTNSTSSQSASNSSANNGSKDANSTDGATASATDGATANNVNANAASNIVGSWKYEKGSDGADYTVVFNADGTGKMINRVAGGEATFKYTTDNGSVTIKYDNYPQAPTQAVPYVVDGKTLIMKYNYGDVYHTKE